MSEPSKGLSLYNTLTRTKEPFVPIDPQNVRMYVCGPTVYDFAHIGNARPAIVFDVLFRLLRQLYGEKHVTYVRNITDVDDKINARALRDFGGEIAAGKLSLNDAIRKVTEQTADQYHKDVAALGCLQPTYEPRATEFVAPRADGKADMLSLIRQLIERGHAYVAGGEVLFDTASMPDYGELSKRNLDEQQAGARIAVDAHKKNPGDFVLWKLSSPEEPGWESPWGRGRPGWHIECSAMSAAYLGEVFDIHGGGLDLIFPHHENEIAQSRCAHGTKVMANVWMHNGFLQVEGQKMSKSLGNFYSIHELLETETFGGRTWPGEVLRLAMLMTHYREPIDFSVRKLEEAENTLRKWKRAADLAPAAANDLPAEVVEALSDDLATYTAFQRLTQLAGEAVEAGGDGGNAAAASLKAALAFLGFDVGAAKVDETAVAKAIADRLEFIAAKNWAEADRIRHELLAQGVQLKDGKDPVTGARVTTWEIKR
ncbi:MULTISPECIES: cysteine--tRNA ligase [unclassified Mesorhizobium]|uniref:cysteine--tRNA ligase n=1 Tax=unclassified Mesorhizobium TaxID=325217 RepID=UPI000F753798|nr:MULTISPECIES: cysteine--tRNA ligase [unclassified Mesorhizobium]AZO06178.1 cysteine--tRNA ligase [Mesorhizobium sp. M2A.F.Ca.ET.043.02.1.1]RUW33868.1 cysteine--tRNA ligase [Mesorhizobium sp. M2A.F.Ca.ET.015.02.1.1]RUW68942.1 cysteine--tRNA ligase [Mesorhizobium sp. M2A.F.Ca.ET.067.02.1.1]RVC95339.1 cysteine--tRNA ligase [Mesorhizobium sp. M2A.F.Ca.ET.017.03.2.1]RVD09250.1 cysteine--tRNA ligase [Mesorhizobium sp. M2A.F.Ca.ET.029.05.1.1]